MQDSGFQVLLQGNNFLRILQGLGVTIGISIVSVLLSLFPHGRTRPPTPGGCGWIPAP